MLDSVLDHMPQPTYVIRPDFSTKESCIGRQLNNHCVNCMRSDYVSTICPLLFRFILHPDTSISQAACYGTLLPLIHAPQRKSPMRGKEALSVCSRSLR